MRFPPWLGNVHRQPQPWPSVSVFVVASLSFLFLLRLFYLFSSISRSHCPDRTLWRRLVFFFNLLFIGARVEGRALTYPKTLGFDKREKRRMKKKKKKKKKAKERTNLIHHAGPNGQAGPRQGRNLGRTTHTHTHTHTHRERERERGQTRSRVPVVHTSFHDVEQGIVFGSFLDFFKPRGHSTTRRGWRPRPARRGCRRSSRSNSRERERERQPSLFIRSTTAEFSGRPSTLMASSFCLYDTRNRLIYFSSSFARKSERTEQDQKKKNKTKTSGPH